MSLVVANNVHSLTARNNVNRASFALGKSLERLSSGLKINRGADGPASLVISEKQRAQIAGLRQAIENSEKAASLVQTAEGALNEINALLVKVRSLALDSANSGVNDADAQAANQAEISNAIDTINRIANNTQFGTKKLLDGSAGVSGITTDADVTFLRATDATAAGSYAVAVTTKAERAFVTAGTKQTAALAAAETLTVNGVQITLAAGLTQTQVRDRVNEFTGQTGATAVISTGALRLYSDNFGTGADISVISSAAAAATSSGLGTTELTDTGVDIDGTIGTKAATGNGLVLTGDAGSDVEGLTLQFAADGTDPTISVTGAQGNVVVADNSLTFQIGPNQNQTVDIALTQANPTSLGVSIAGNQFSTLNDIDVTNADKAQDSLEVIDAAIDEITNMRGTLGAFQANTLESTANNLRETLENTVNAESVIRDTDFAEEIAEYTKQQVLVQTSATVLGNANQIPQLALQLLQ